MYQSFWQIRHLDEYSTPSTPTREDDAVSDKNVSVTISSKSTDETITIDSGKRLQEMSNAERHNLARLVEKLSYGGYISSGDLSVLDDDSMSEFAEHAAMSGIATQDTFYNDGRIARLHEDEEFQRGLREVAARDAAEKKL